MKPRTGQEDRSPELDPQPPGLASRWVQSSTPRAAHRLYCVAELGLAEPVLLGKAPQGGPGLRVTSLWPGVRCVNWLGQEACGLRMGMRSACVRWLSLP